MNCTHALMIMVGLSVMALSHRATAQEIRTWKSQSGASVEASFISESHGVVTLQTADGNRVQIRRSILTPQDEAYLKRVLYKPKTITVSLEPNTALGYLLYTEARQPVNKSGQASIDPRKRYESKQEGPEHAQQCDTICFSIQSQFDGKWMDDSTWNVLRAENLGQQITGNADYSDEHRNTDGSFLRVVFKLANNGKSDSYVTVPRIVDGKEREFTIIDNSRYFIPKDFTDPHLDKIAPGFTRTYCAIYEIPKDATDCRLKVSTLDKFDFRGGGTYIPMGGRLIVLDVEEVK